MKMNANNIEQEFRDRYVKQLTAWIVFHRMVVELDKMDDYYDTEAILVKMDIPSIIKVVNNLYETDKEGLDKLYDQSIEEIEHLKALVNRVGGQ